MAEDTSFASSAEIFAAHRTLPQIRAIQKTLHVQIDEKSSRLRTQVGGSYRELLGTADAIVQMRSDNDDLQHLLGNMGGRCGRAIVTAKADSLKSFVSKQKNNSAAGTARLKLLDGCALSADSLLRGGKPTEATTKGDRLVLVAKLLVLGRLLLSSLDDATSKTSVAAKKTLDALRRKLRRAIDNVLEQPGDDSGRDDILKALCARSLASSSGAKDALRYFLDRREEAMAVAFDTEDEERTKSTDSVVHALKLYTRTLLDVQALLPIKLPQALAALKQHRLLADTSLKQLESLRLDTYERWCSEDIQYFTPFIRHDDLDGKTAREMLSTWADKGTQDLLKGLKGTLEGMADFKSIMDLRTEVLRLWIRDGGKAKGFDPLELQQDLRETINERMLAVLETKVSKLRLVGTEVKATLEGWQDGITDKHDDLWEQDGYDDTLARGAAPFLQEVTNRLYGRNDAVSKAVHSYLSWFKVIDDITEVVEALGKQRWDNDFDEVEDEETIEARQQVLSKEDPKMLQNKLDSTLDATYKALESTLSELWKERQENKQSHDVAAYILRILRDVRSKLPDRPAIKSFGLEMVPSLQTAVATNVSGAAVDNFVTSGLSQREVESQPLWEGEPALPNQPSPSCFNALHDLSTAMAKTGTDIWTPAAVKILKAQLTDGLSQAWKAELEKVADEENVEALLTQWLFDAALLQSCLGSGLEGVVDSIHKQSKLDEASRKRITKAAGEFWQRISFLFGLLA